MKKTYYLPASGPERVVWLNNFYAELNGGYASTFGISTHMALLNLMILLYAFLINLQESIKGVKEQLTDFKDTFADGPLHSAAPVFPTISFTYAGTLPAESGLFAFVRFLVGIIKKHAAYTTDIGQRLRIIGDEMSPPGDEGPDLKGSVKDGKAHLGYHHHHHQGMFVYGDHDDGLGMKLLGHTTGREFIDPYAVPSGTNSVLCKYQARYMDHDAPVGEMSDIVELTLRIILP